MGDRSETVTVYLCLFNILECIFFNIFHMYCAFVFVLFFLEKKFSHMNTHLLVLKTFQAIHCNDKISLSHNSLWPGCIICDYSRILGQARSWWVTFHFWKKKRSLYSLIEEIDRHLCWEKTLSSYLLLTHEVAHERLFIAGLLFFYTSSLHFSLKHTVLPRQ